MTLGASVAFTVSAIIGVNYMKQTEFTARRSGLAAGDERRAKLKANQAEYELNLRLQDQALSEQNVERTA